MKKQILVALTLCFLSMQPVVAQVVVTGSVVDDETKTPLKSVIIKAVNRNASVLAYTQTDKAGKFTVNIPKGNMEFNLSAEHLSYNKEVRHLTSATQTIQFSLVQKYHELKEVVIKAPSILQRGDTLTYNVASFVTNADFTLKDVIRRLPGIEVSDNGRIKYLGKDISQFYIEDVDLLGGKYNLATNNIPAEYVDAVQVYNNHQPVKMNKDMFSDDVALNIKLNNKAKFKPVGTIEGLLGKSNDGALYQFSGAGMMFAKKFQSIATIKIGNAYTFSTDANTDHFSSKKNETLSKEVLGNISLATPPLTEDRYSNPKDQLYTLSSSLKLSEDKSFKINLGYAYAHHNHSYCIKNEYYTGDSNVVIEQNKSYTSAEKTPFVSFEYKNNSQNAYITNSFSANASFADTELPAERNGQLTRQKQNIDSYNISNEFIANWRHHRWSINTSNIFQMSISPEALLNISFEDQSITQKVKSSNLSITQNFACVYVNGCTRLYLPVSIKFRNQYLQSELSGDSNNVTGNDGTFNDIGICFSPKYEYSTSKLNFRTSIVTGVDYFKNNDKKNVANKNLYKMSFCPEIDLNYNITPYLSYRTRIAYNRSYGDIKDFLISPIRTDILTERQSLGLLSNRNVLSAKLHVDYKFPISQCFLYVDINYRNIRYNIITSQVVSDELIKYIDYPQTNNSNLTTVSANAVKRIASINTKLSINMQCSFNRQHIIQNDMLIKTTTKTYAISPSIVSKPFSFLDFSYIGFIRKSMSHYLSTNKGLWQQSHKMKFFVSPWKSLLINAAVDFLKRDINENVSKSFTLFDCGISYRKKSFRYSLSMNNIFNQRQYSYLEYNSVNTYSYQYELRGRQLLFSISYTR